MFRDWIYDFPQKKILEIPRCSWNTWHEVRFLQMSQFRIRFIFPFLIYDFPKTHLSGVPFCSWYASHQVSFFYRSLNFGSGSSFLIECLDSQKHNYQESPFVHETHDIKSVFCIMSKYSFWFSKVKVFI